MRKQFLFGISICFFSAVHAQTTYSVNFDTYVSATNNDLVNDFSGGFAMTQQTTNGITGGSVLPASTTSASQALYNTKSYVGLGDPNPSSVSICFKYSAAGGSSGDDGPVAGFKIGTDSVGAPAAGFVNASVSAYPFGGSEINVDGATQHYSSASFNMTDGHWFQLKLTVKATSTDSLNTDVYVYDIGAAGTSTPVLAGSFLNNSETITGITWPHSYFLAAFNGGLSGGVVYMDNFNVNSYSAPTGIAPVEILTGLTVSNPVTNSLSVITATKSDIQYVIYNVAGATMKTGSISGPTDIDVSSLPASLYLIRFVSGNSSIVEKFVKE